MSAVSVSAKKAFLQVATVLLGASGAVAAADFAPAPMPQPLRQKNGEIDSRALLNEARAHYEQRHRELQAPAVQEALRGDDLPVRVRVPVPQQPEASKGIKPYHAQIMKMAEGIVRALKPVTLNLGAYSQGTHFDMMNKLQDPGARNKYDSRLSRAYKAAKETGKSQVFSTISGDPHETYQFAVRVNTDGSALLVVRERDPRDLYHIVFAAAVSDRGKAANLDPKTVSVAQFGLNRESQQVPLEPTTLLMASPISKTPRISP